MHHSKEKSPWVTRGRNFNGSLGRGDREISISAAHPYDHEHVMPIYSNHRETDHHRASIRGDAHYIDQHHGSLKIIPTSCVYRESAGGQSLHLGSAAAAAAAAATAAAPRDIQLL